MKQSISKQNKKRWAELSKELRNGRACEYCGSKEHLQVHHISCSKFYKKSILRFDKANLCVVCSKHHFLAHHSPIEFMEWFKQNRYEDYIYCLNILRVLRIYGEGVILNNQIKPNKEV